MKNKKAQFYMMGAIAMLMAIYILSMFTKEMTILSIKRVTNERMYFLTLKMNHDVYFIKDHEKNYVSLFNDLSAYFSQSEEIFQKNGIDFLWNFTNYSISFEIQAPYLIINNTLLFKQPLIKPPAIKKYVCIVINSTSFLDSLFTGKLPILINNSNNPNDLTNFQISLNLTYLPGMSPTFQDIRFVYYNTTTNQYQELPYWIQSKVDGKWAYVWIKVPFIPSNTTNIGYGNGITYIWLYYNNITTLPNDPLANNGTATFEFFDDFNGNKISTNKWYIYKLSAFYGKYGVSYGDLYIYGDTYYPWYPTWGNSPGSSFFLALQSRKSFNLPIEVEFKTRSNQIGATMRNDITFAYNTLSPLNNYVDIDWDSQAPLIYYKHSASYSANVQEFYDHLPDTKWHLYKIIIKPNYIALWQDWSRKWHAYTKATPTFTSPGKITITADNEITGGGDFTDYWDWIFVRKYTNPEPTTKLILSPINLHYGNVSWWNNNFENRTYFAILNPYNKVLTNFQISLNLTYLPGMSPTFQDIRFVYYNTTTNQYQELPYWIQSKVDGKWAYVWIKVPFIPSNTTNIGYGNGITYIWLYYNNITTLPNDPLANNGTATFEFFDDFENNPNTDGKWVIFRDHTSNVECYWDPTTHLFYLTKAYNGLGCMAFFAKNGKPIKINYPFLAEFEYKVGGGTGADGMTFAFDKDITNFEKYNDSVGGGTLGLLPSSPTGVVPSNGYAIELDEYYNYEFDPSGDHVALVLNGPSDHLIYYNTPKVKDNQWHTLKAIVSPPITKVYLDNQLLFTYTKLTPLGYGYAGFSGATGALTDNHIIKFVLVRKYFPNPLLIVPSHYYQYLNCSYITT